MNKEQALFAAGCFWGVEVMFRNTDGVLDAIVGYSGGHTNNPIYEDVCTGTTGHAESVLVTFDTEKITFEKLVRVFFGGHDPTTMNRQGPDIGEQYRSAIFYFTPEQKEIAEKVKQELDASGKYKLPIVTEITQAGEFYRAEEYHQRYLEKNGMATCRV